MANQNPPPRPPSKVLSDRAVEASKEALAALGEELLEGEISLAEFEDTFKAEMKSQYIAQYLLGIGGLAYMTSDDWARVAVDLEKQYRFADDYIVELRKAQDEEAQAMLLLNNGEMVLDDDGNLLDIAAVASLLWRLSLYADSAGTVYETANTAAHERDGYDEELWNLDDGVENHCETCPEFASRGWQPIGTFPEPGDGHTECGNRCHCWKSYRKFGSGEE